MICPSCNCFTETSHFAEDCLDALLIWRKEADARLIAYEAKSVEREALIELYRDVVDDLGGSWVAVENKHDPRT